MDREIVLAALALALCGPSLIGFGLLRLPSPRAELPRQLERQTWRALWLPLVPAALLLSFLIGWALQEPDASERARGFVFLIATPFALVWLRALTRALRALAARPHRALAATSGLFQPRVFIAPELRARLDEAALRAAVEHEAAHARHRDPLRLWLAQLGTDLQWPAAAAGQRFARWRAALELARDEEACERGVEGSDLAAALIETARLGGDRTRGAFVGLVDDAGVTAFRERVMRLLEGSPPTAGVPARASRMGTLLAGLLVVVIAVGACYGEAIIGQLSGLTR